MPRKPARSQAPAAALDFSTLVEAIRSVHDHSASVAKRAVNTSLTLRNWVIGAYIVEYQLHGADRAKYGEQIVEKLANELSQRGIPTCERPRLFGFILTRSKICGNGKIPRR